MSATITPERLELCRLVREHCSGWVGQPAIPLHNWTEDELAERRLCEAALDVPIEVMAGWFMMDETVLANIRLAMTMAEQTMVR